MTILNGRRRQQLGLVACFENDRGDRLTVHRNGGDPTVMFAELIEHVSGLDPSWRMVCYSNPDTILADIQGRVSRSCRGRRPEEIMLGRIGRMDMLHPRLAGRRHDRNPTGPVGGAAAREQHRGEEERG